ncbi:hypothetical protein DPMN_024135 [Dreissena polymorpha]|uniref:Uncharacterized protein n=1 Tax=Dreissena polymorpha TaxID=45954 RepID=A0A9D4RBB9_DREPO|nr:hypothetical protein DPMN_024135 [Dreissena polymorpha]
MTLLNAPLTYIVGVKVVLYAVDAIRCKFPKKAQAVSHQMHQEKRHTIQHSAEVLHLFFVSVSSLQTLALDAMPLCPSQVIKTSLYTCVGAKRCPHCIVYGLLVVTCHHPDVWLDVSIIKECNTV